VRYKCRLLTYLLTSITFNMQVIHTSNPSILAIIYCIFGIYFRTLCRKKTDKEVSNKELTLLAAKILSLRRRFPVSASTLHSPRKPSSKHLPVNKNFNIIYHLHINMSLQETIFTPNPIPMLHRIWQCQKPGNTLTATDQSIYFEE